jgi:Ca2+:H+ antiporter
MNWLLLFVPVAIGVEVLAPERYLLVFVTSSLAILPLAGWMGRATEQLAEHFGEGVGGFLNATFGNAAELIIALAALRAGLHDVVKASIAGSIIAISCSCLALPCWPGACGTPSSTSMLSGHGRRRRC